MTDPEHEPGAGPRRKFRSVYASPVALAAIALIRLAARLLGPAAGG